MTVTTINVKYGRTVSGPKEYESRRADAEIGVALEEGETNVDIELDEAMAYAMNVVHTTLGIGGGGGKSTAATTAATSKASGSTKGNISDNPEDRKDPEAEELTPAQKAARTRAANKAKKEAEERAAAEAEAAAEAAEIEKLDGNQAAADDIPMGDDDDVIDVKASVADDDDDDFNIEDPVEAEDEGEEITDAELATIINKKVKTLKAQSHPDAVKVVKAAIAAFNDEADPNFTAANLTQAQRRKLTSKLKAIKGPEA